MYGLLAEFSSADELVAAVRRAHAEGYRHMDTYSPFPLEGIADALGLRRTSVPLIVLIGGVLGCLTGYFMQYYLAAVYYPINVGGRPLHSWPSFIPITFELTVLFAGLFAVFGMLALNGLPMPSHPVFNAPRFALATRNRFFLAIEATDPKFDRVKTRQFLQSLAAYEVSEVGY
jgi:hypothetical protein